MEKILVVLALVISSAVFAGTPIEKEIPVWDVFAPFGFDTNDNVEIIVTGNLPNLCHKAPQSYVEVKEDKIFIKLTSLYYDQTNPYCPKVMVPFTETVRLGVMEKGKYEIIVNGQTVNRKKAEISVAESTSNSVDEHTYALVNYIDKDLSSRKVTLKGYNPSDCFVLDKIDVVSNGKDTYSVLPKMKKISDHCPMKMIPFEYDFMVPKTLNKEVVLLHVRTMDGNSVNSVFYNNIAK